MPKVEIKSEGCRGCELCKDICPVDVFTIDEKTAVAEVGVTEDCIGCLSCYYVCPSQCIGITEHEPVRPFHRIEENVALVEKLLQEQPAASVLSSDELDAAYYEVGMLLAAFAETINEVLGRGHKAVGRRAGQVAAAHLPEMYEQRTLDALLKRMRHRLGASLPFEYAIDGDSIEMRIRPCGLLKSVEKSGSKPNKCELCLLFHEYWAGLLSTYTGTQYGYEIPEAGPTCVIRLQPRVL